MAKLRGVDAKLSRLHALRRETATPEHIVELRNALADKSNLIAADAAQIVGERLLAELTPDLIAAFDRFMIEPEETDKLCRAKIAIVEALNKIEYEKEDIFLTAIHHVQLEGRWGGDEDAAAPLRAEAAFALVRINVRNVVLLLADLLADPTRTARVAAARALGGTGAAAAIPLLRFKVHVGDKDPEVINECLTALMAAAPVESLEFVADRLNSGDDAIRDGAAFALGESRRPEALDVLMEQWPRAHEPSFREVLLLAIAMTRLPVALEFLMGILAEDRRASPAALSALAIHRHNDAIRDRIAAILVERQDSALQMLFDKKFGQ